MESLTNPGQFIDPSGVLQRRTKVMGFVPRAHFGKEVYPRQINSGHDI